jgi:hypothetical protein
MARFGWKHNHKDIDGSGDKSSVNMDVELSAKVLKQLPHAARSMWVRTLVHFTTNIHYTLHSTQYTKLKE